MPLKDFLFSIDSHLLTQRITKFVLLLLVFTSFYQCTPEGQTDTGCKCGIEKMVDAEGGTSKDTSDESWNAELEVRVVPEILKKVIESQASVAGKYSNSDTKIQETYWKVLGDNPRVTQFANLYRTVACAYYVIICEDHSLTAKERREALFQVVRGYEENIDEIVKISKQKSKNTDSSNPVSPMPGDKKKTETTVKSENSTKYFNTSVQTDIAILNTGNRKNANLGSLLRTYFTGEGVKNSTSFFRPVFEKEYANSLESEDYAALKTLGLQRNIQCICFVQQNIRLTQNQYEGNAFQTATGNYQVKIFNFKTADIASFSIHENGAGATDDLAQESLEEKFIETFKQKSINPGLCKK